MEAAKIIGNNIKEFRNRLGLSQEQVGAFIGVDRTTITRYENAEREISLTQLEKFCDLFAIELKDLLEVDEDKRKANLFFAFRAEGIVQEDLESIASFQKVVKNYLKMKSISNEAK